MLIQGEKVCYFSILIRMAEAISPMRPARGAMARRGMPFLVESFFERISVTPAILCFPRLLSIKQGQAFSLDFNSYNTSSLMAPHKAEKLKHEYMHGLRDMPFRCTGEYVCMIKFVNAGHLGSFFMLYRMNDMILLRTPPKQLICVS
jgi:hypothetical protein